MILITELFSHCPSFFSMFHKDFWSHIKRGAKSRLQHFIVVANSLPAAIYSDETIMGDSKVCTCYSCEEERTFSNISELKDHIVKVHFENARTVKLSVMNVTELVHATKVLLASATSATPRFSQQKSNRVMQQLYALGEVVHKHTQDEDSDACIYQASRKDLLLRLREQSIVSKKSVESKVLLQGAQWLEKEVLNSMDAR